MTRLHCSSVANLAARLLVLACLLTRLLQAQAAPTITSTVAPATATSPMVFTFSEAMDTDLTFVTFVDATTFSVLTTTDAWTDGDKVFTCTPVSPWPAGHTIYWSAEGSSALGVDLTGTTLSMFTVAGGSTGCDPSAPLLSLTVSKGWTYDQTSANAPTLDPFSPYCFLGCISLPCPRDATNVTLRAPGGVPANMTLTAIPGHLTLTDCRSTSAELDAAYPAGDYLFNIQAATSNQQVTVNFQTSLIQPPAPRVSNYAAAQTINPGEPFVLTWDAWANAPANACIYFEISGVFSTPAPTEMGALPGTATSVTIPALALQANQDYSGLLTFYHYLWLTNGTSYGALTYRATTTQFTLSTSEYRPAITDGAWAGAGTFRFDVACPVGQALTAQWNTNPASTNWTSLASTNSTTQRVRFTDPAAGTRPRCFYRVITGF